MLSGIQVRSTSTFYPPYNFSRVSLCSARVPPASMVEVLEGHRRRGGHLGDSGFLSPLAHGFPLLIFLVILWSCAPGPPPPPPTLTIFLLCPPALDSNKMSPRVELGGGGGWPMGPCFAALTILMTFPPTRQLLKETTPGSFCEVLEMGRLWSLMSWKERRFGSCCGVGLARTVGGWPRGQPRLWLSRDQLCSGCGGNGACTL